MDATITFRAKVESVYHMDDSLAWQQIRVPTLARRHCDMTAFRDHKRLGGLANSDLFPVVLAKIRRDILGGPDRDYIRMDRIPDGVVINSTGFLATVTITVAA